MTFYLQLALIVFLFSLVVSFVEKRHKLTSMGKVVASSALAGLLWPFTLVVLVVIGFFVAAAIVFSLFVDICVSTVVRHNYNQ